MKNKKNESIIRMVVTVIVIILLVWFIIVNPLLKFKTMEKEVLESSERYFEINASKLPTGNKIRKISLQTLYDQDFIKEDLRAPYTNKYCDAENSWVRVTKDNNEYKYSVYLECGMFKSKTDHKGPEIKLNGEEEITVYQGEKYKDAGIKSVIDDTDGKMKTSQVKVDTSKVNTDVVGTYKVTYTVSDSLENKTEVVRTVKVIQTLNNVVKKNTDKTKIYKGAQANNYLKIDEILFKIVGTNSDGSVKIVSKDALASVDYDGVDSWLNDYFYEQLSDSVKKYIKDDSKWCIDKVSNPNDYKKCSKYSKKKAVGVLSIIDYKNALDSDGISNLENATAVWTANSKSDKKAWVNSYYNVADGYIEYKELEQTEVINVKPAMNIIEDATIISGDGSMSNPYILKGNKQKVKKGTKVSKLRTGSYISYSGYTWRVISKEADNTTKIIMNEPVSGNNSTYYSQYDNEANSYDPTRKNNLGYVVVNQISEYVKTDYLVNKKISVKKYGSNVLYNNEKSTKNYKVKLSAVSMFDLYSTERANGVSTWYQESATNKVYLNSATVGTVSVEFSSDEINGVKLVGYLNENVVIKEGSGTENDPFTLTK